MGSAARRRRCRRQGFSGKPEVCRVGRGTLPLRPLCPSLLPTPARAAPPSPPPPADSALVVGGQHYKGWLSRFVWLYNATEDSWTRVGQLPVHARGQACALHAGRLLVTLGQQGMGETRVEWTGWEAGRSYEAPRRACPGSRSAAAINQPPRTRCPAPAAEGGLAPEPGLPSARQFLAPLPLELAELAEAAAVDGDTA